MKKKYIFFCSVLIIILLMVVTILFWNIPWERKNGSFVYYEGMLFSSNEKYNGIIDTYKEEVIISDYLGKEVSHVDIEDCYPDQIVLGDNNYYLLYQQENGDARIIQYDFQSIKHTEYRALNTAVIAYKNGYLFMGEWMCNGEDRNYFISCDYMFYANNYISEKEFGTKPVQLKSDSTKRCFIGNIEMFYHEDGYFSTEPLVNDYRGISQGSFTASDDDYHAETKQEIKNRTLLLSQIGNKHGVYKVFEYQLGNDIYGVCNVFENGKYIPSLPIESQDVSISFFYKINPANDEITILLKENSCIGLSLSENVAVYKKNNMIESIDFKTGEKEVIYIVKNEHNLGLYIQQDYIMIVEEKKRMFQSIFPTDENFKSVVKWNIF